MTKIILSIWIQDSRFANVGFNIQDSRSKKNFLNPGARIRRGSGCKKFFFESCILNLESWASLVCKRFQTVLVTKLLQVPGFNSKTTINTHICIYIWYPPLELKLNTVICPKSVATSKTSVLGVTICGVWPISVYICVCVCSIIPVYTIYYTYIRYAYICYTYIHLCSMCVHTSTPNIYIYMHVSYVFLHIQYDMCIFLCRYIDVWVWSYITNHI